jgi:hypothetical protein
VLGLKLKKQIAGAHVCRERERGERERERERERKVY